MWPTSGSTTDPRPGEPLRQVAGHARRVDQVELADQDQARDPHRAEPVPRLSCPAAALAWRANASGSCGHGFRSANWIMPSTWPACR